MPDFTVKNNFPIADVINAAQRKAQIDQETRNQNTQQTMSGIQAIGQMGQALVDKRLKVAQALALGKQFGISDDQARLMDPDQVLKVAAANKGFVDSDFLKSALLALGGRVPTSPTATASTAPTPVSTTPTPAPAAPSSPPAASGPIMLTGGQAPVSSPAPAPDPSAPVPIAAPPARPKMVNPATAKLAVDVAKANAIEPVVTRAGAESAGGVKHGTHILPDPNGVAGGKADKEYDTLENQVINRIVGIRGDKSLARTEEQRDAASQAYNTIQQIKSENRLPNQMEYYDILGQMWKARTGAAPTDQSIRDLDASTFKGDIGKAYQYFSGHAAPRTTADIMNAIQSFAKQSGMQADKLHAGYMQSHLIKPRNMSQSDFDRIVQAHRGQTFSEATGLDQAGGGATQPQGAGWNDANEQRLQLLLNKKANGTIKS